MRTFSLPVSLAVPVLAVLAQTPAQRPPEPAEFQALQAHFDRAVAARHANAFRGITSVADWEKRKTELRQRLSRMLWYDYELPNTPPPVRITNRTEYPAYVLENIVLETAPKVFATANLYLPRTGSKPFPVVLYQCGHANKSYYAKHGAWFAAHGIAAMVMDNIEMGEIEFTHHGVYARAWFHWYSRGFSPLAAELLNARRIVDYLVSRPDLDKNRIGATGRSGGGMTTFFLAALDERIKASAPVSGTLSTSGWVRKRLTSAHCDCQYPVNSYGMLYSEVGAMIAPRAQLVANADADRGFPMDTFNELVEKMGEIYKLYGAERALLTAVAPGGHNDIEAIRVPVFSFFLKEFLGQTNPLTSEGPIDEPKPETLVCFREGLPVDERLTRIDEELVPQRRVGKLPELISVLRNEVFRYFPAENAALDAKWNDEPASHGRTVKKVTFSSFDGLRVRGIYSLPQNSSGKLPALLIVDDRKGIRVWGNEQPLERNRWGNRAVLIVETLDRGTRALETNLRSFVDDDPLHHMKRQAMVMGTTLESMQVYEVLRSLELLRTLPEIDAARITVTGKGEAGVNGLYAAALDGNVQQIILGSSPASHRDGPHYLGILRYTDIPETIALMRGKIKLYGDTPDILRGKGEYCSTLAACLGTN